MSTAYECMSLEQMVSRMHHFHPTGDAALIEKAYAFAEKVHGGQRRLSGEPYIVHPVYVASILTEIGIDAPTIAAGLLHDTVEDCDDVTLDTIREEFGDEVSRLVDGVTKLSKLDFTNREEQQAETLRKMILAMGKDIRVVLIKLADRLHNMRTLKFKTPERQVAIARETLDIYAPLAHRLGVYTIKAELEDLSLRYIDPEGYQEVARKVGMKRAEREANIQIVMEELSQKLDEMGIKHDIAGRPKHLYSIYRKMVLHNKPFEQIYDLIAIRVLVNTIPECYTVLGVCHTLWSQVPNRFKDYISVPKNNMYQSLHTTVVGGRRVPFPFEVQIRTYEMHHVAEYGIAAHWRYKERSSNQDSFDKKLFWLRQVLDWQSEAKDSYEFLNGLKTDLFSEQVFIFTPKGDIIDMPRGATPLDFAYRVHSAVGNSCVGAKINGRIVPLETPLETGDRVEIMTSSSSKGPSMDWLKIVKTQAAKSKIRQYFKRELRGENVAKGKDMLEREAKRRGLALSTLMQDEYVQPLLNRYSLQDEDDVFGAVGSGMLASAYVISRLFEEQHKAAEQAAPKAPPQLTEEKLAEIQKGKPTQGIYVEGGSGMLVRFARCCNPVPGDDIVGYITRGRGVTVHKTDCVNADNNEPERKVNVSWAQESLGRFNTTISVTAYDHESLLGELTVYIQDSGAPISAVNVKVNPNRTCSIQIVVQVESRGQLDNVIRRLQKRPDVIEAFRVGG